MTCEESIVPFDETVNVTLTEFQRLRQAAKDLEELERVRHNELELTIPRKDYVALLDAAIELTHLKDGSKVVIDAEELATLRDGVQGSAAILLKNLVTGTEVSVDGEPHRLVGVEKLDELTRDSDLLCELYTGGVDNWDGFDDARARHFATFPPED